MPEVGEVRIRGERMRCETLAGRTLSDELRNRLLRSQRGGVFEGRERAISTAAAIAALSAVFDERGRPDPEAQAARARAVGVLNGLGQVSDPGGYGGLRAQAAIVTALATSGVSDLDSREAYDPVGQVLRTWLPPLRRNLRDVPGEPSLLAQPQSVDGLCASPFATRRPSCCSSSSSSRSIGCSPCR